MKASDLPTIKLPIPFADEAVAPYKHEVPVESQIGITDGAASLETGFPPDNFLTPGAGGVPPFGNDVNGILFEISAWTRWYNGGGAIFPYDAAFAIDISGYPKGAICSGTAGGTTFYISVVDDNLVDPTTAPGASWQVFGLGNSGVAAGTYVNATVTFGLDGRATSAANGTLPTRTSLLSGSATYTTPAGCRQLRIRMCGGGAGGGAETTNNGGAGGTTSFGSFTAIGGSGGQRANLTRFGGTGGTGGAGAAAYRCDGGDGTNGDTTTGTAANCTAGNGGSNPFGGAGRGGAAGTAGQPGKANTGGGGGGGAGAGAGAGAAAAGGGGAGEYVELIINNPAASYAYAVGAAGIAGAAGNVAGGLGGSGVILIDEIY